MTTTTTTTRAERLVRAAAFVADHELDTVTISDSIDTLGGSRISFHPQTTAESKRVIDALGNAGWDKRHIQAGWVTRTSDDADASLGYGTVTVHLPTVSERRVSHDVVELFA